MDKILPLTFVTDTDPIDKAILDASGWFETEFITVNGTQVDTPTSSTVASSYMEWYLAQGWVLYDTTYATRSIVGSTVTSNITYFLKRRKLQSELVLQDMITDFTSAYNEGRSINDQRYDEIVAIWNAGLDKTEDEINLLAADSDAYDDIVENILAQLSTDLATLETDLDGILDDYGDSRRTDINTRFDSESAKAKQSLIDKGLYNTTLWDSTSAGVEREREQALTDFEDTLIERTVAIELALNDARVKTNAGLIDAHNRWIKLRQDNKLTPLDFRNRILTAMLNFMERRTDSYPGLDNLAGMAAQLGYSDGAATVSPS